MAGLKIALVHDARLPVRGYGGTERVVWWLAKGLAELGHEVVLACRKGSECPFAKVVPVDFDEPVARQLPAVQLIHFQGTPPRTPEVPYLVTIHGNGKPGERFLPNTNFVSRNHAERHGATAYVHNGLDPDEYLFAEQKESRLLFLGKARWRVKNVRGAIRIARAAKLPLSIVGGSSWLSWGWRALGVRWEGTLGGEAKRELVARSAALVFPVLWHEPFGIAVVEALVSGTPVVASPFGSLPELVPPHVGRLCDSEESMVQAIAGLGEVSPHECRRWALENFHYRVMTSRYVELYRRILDGEPLHSESPVTTVLPTAGIELPRRKR